MKNSRRNQEKLNAAPKIGAPPVLSRFAAKRAAERASAVADSPFAVLATLGQRE